MQAIRAQKRKRTVATGAQGEPLTTAEVKTHLRVDHANDDTYIDTLIVAATDYTETVLSRSLIAGTFDAYLDAFPVDDDESIWLPYPPLISITSIKYYDDLDVEQTWSASEYVIDNDVPYKGHVYPGRTYSWPSARNFHKAVHIEYIAGYADSAASPVDLADNIPREIKHALLLLIGHWYENREDTAAGIAIETIPTAYDALIASYRVRC